MYAARDTVVPPTKEESYWEKNELEKEVYA